MRGTSAIFSEPGRGGVNLQDAPYLLKDFEARDARNMVGSTRGAVRKRAGAVTFATPDVELGSLFASQDPVFLVGAGGTVIYSIAPDGTVTSIATGQTSGLRWEWANAPASGGQGPVWGMNGTDPPLQWTGSGTTAAWTASTGILPNGQFVIYQQRRLWVAGMTSYSTIVDPGSTLVFSNLGDPRDWPAANVVEFDPADGEAISGLGTIGSSLLVFKPSKAWVVYGLDTGANRPLAGGVGCVAHRSIVETPQGTFFLSKDHGVMVTDGSTVKRVSDRVLPMIESMSQAQAAAAVGWYFDDHYYLSFSTGGAHNDITVDYDAKTDAWWVHTLGLQDIAAWQPSSVWQLYSADGGQARVSRLFVDGETQDNGAPFASYWSGPFHTFGKPHLRKRLRQVRFDGRGRIQLSVTPDFQQAPSLAVDEKFDTDTGSYGVNDDGGLFGVNDSNTTTLFGGMFTVGQARALNLGVARAWSLTFGNNTTDDIEIDSYTMAFTPRSN